VLTVRSQGTAAHFNTGAPRSLGPPFGAIFSTNNNKRQQIPLPKQGPVERDALLSLAASLFVYLFVPPRVCLTSERRPPAAQAPRRRRPSRAPSDFDARALRLEL